MMSTQHTTSTENVFHAACIRPECPRTASVHQRRRGGLDGFGTMTMWKGPRRPDHQCVVPADLLQANEAMLRARAVDAEAEAGRLSTWNFTSEPTTEVLTPLL